MLWKALARGALCAAALILVAGCSSSSSSASNSGGSTPPPQPQAIQGIATPKTIAVVTANNAN
jgi:hypothetical protein